ncbi:transcription termination/antitermination NusG family protein [Ensifer adhaerens]|uniref:transcription termination/antitermination NusG family protein n=1 Tax=Ensifer adhaerens TaxID=106592 RepID=UPI00384A747B
MSWYAIKNRPGTQRPATPRIGEPEDRKGEFIIERNLRDADIEIYMPSFRKDIKHHRTKELIERRFAMIVGYSFVYLPTSDFYRLSRVDGVTSILGVAGYPTRISNFDVESIRDAEAIAGASLQRERDARKKRTRKELQEEYPKDVTVRIAPEHRLVGGMLATVLDVTGRNTVKAVVEMLGGLVHVDLPLDLIDKVA